MKRLAMLAALTALALVMGNSYGCARPKPAPFQTADCGTSGCAVQEPARFQTADGGCSGSACARPEPQPFQTTDNCVPEPAPFQTAGPWSNVARPEPIVTGA